MDQPRYLFVGGVARSGTTALATVLNAHPRICLGIERYKYLFKESPYTQDLFAEQRFFDFRASDTNNLPDKGWAAFYDGMRVKFPRAALIGDKLPGVERRAPALFEVFGPTTRLIYMLRDPLDVAASWERRAQSLCENRQQANGYKEAVLTWNKTNRYVMSLMSKGLPIRVVNSERFFSSDEAELSELGKYLRINPRPNLMAEYGRACVRFQRGGAKMDSVLHGAPEEYVRSTVDLAAYDVLLRHAQQPVASDG